MHNRRSIRLKNYDYSQSGLYFVTICTQGGIHYLGEIVDGKICVSHYGNIVTYWLGEIENKFPSMNINIAVVMPNHIHFILRILPLNGRVNIINDWAKTNEGRTHRSAPTDTTVGVDRRVYPEPDQRVYPENIVNDNTKQTTVGDVIQWFKTMTTNAYIRGVKSNKYPGFHKRIWQRNYYEHIILNEQRYKLIRNYIINNPKSWEQDRFNHRNSLHEERSVYGNGWDWVL